MVARTRGFTVLEVVIALSVITVVVTAAWAGVRAHQMGIAGAWSELAASQAASNRIEVLRDAKRPLTAGTSSFEPTMRGASGSQRVREVEPGLYEVEVEVRHESEGARVFLVTRVAREVTP